MSDLSEAFSGPPVEHYVPVCRPAEACFIASHVDHQQGFVRDTYLERPSVRVAPIAVTSNIAKRL